MPAAVVSTWYGTFVVDGERVLVAERAPTETAALAERTRLRRSGALTPEETAVLGRRGGAGWTTRDRRLVPYGIRWDPRAPGTVPKTVVPGSIADARAFLLADAEAALAAAWDPSVHVQEAVRALADLDRVRNLLGERLGSWASRDHPELDPGDHARAARAALEADAPGPLSPRDPGVAAARRRLAELYSAVEGARAALLTSVETASPAQTPNLAALLGPELAARLVAQAGGLERLARLPSSTVQVLGAERAFFEHLRGRASPPRHGLLFTHPALQSAPRSERGKLARALAGKVAIAARLDAHGAAVEPSLARAFDARRAELKSRRGRPTRAGRRSGTRLPLDRAAGDR